MKYLFDTHVMLWFLEDADELSKKARQILQNGENELFWSAASFWELTVKISLGKLKLQKGWQAFLEQEKKVNRILDLPIHERHCEPHLTLPWIHRDPFDRLLICQAISEKFTLLTKDEIIRQYPVKTVW
ncbi:MAG: type II toxin-antitoxin system VapC family toxin [Nitrospirota bacterium]|nr:type II toxin-antitoxin system VapC family toxin [Nitrospirota bacterium]MDH5588236.1 type II toxin-antitoxin system VapC family toxin [Nitrospirota bacterium]MDH5774506.1 type II toxin-antitoxin system VapC family toxin [Nitrospirota bacterium]